MGAGWAGPHCSARCAPQALRGRGTASLSFQAPRSAAAPASCTVRACPGGVGGPVGAVTIPSVPSVTPQGSVQPGVLWVQRAGQSGAARQGCHGAPRYPGTVTLATAGCHLCGLKVAGTAGSSRSVPSAASSCPGSHRQSGPADRQHALPAPQAAEGAHGGRARPQRPPPPARLQGGLAAGPAQG